MNQNNSPNEGGIFMAKKRMLLLIHLICRCPHGQPNKSERRPEYGSRLSQSESFPLLLVTVPAR